MDGLLEGMQLIDSTLVQTIDVNIQTQLILRTIEAGSLKSWFRNLVEIAGCISRGKAYLKYRIS